MSVSTRVNIAMRGATFSRRTIVTARAFYRYVSVWLKRIRAGLP